VEGSEYRVTGPSGRKVILVGWRRAYWEDDGYERLKMKMREMGGPGTRVSVEGRRYALFELEDGHWALVTEVQKMESDEAGRTTIGPPSAGRIERFETEVELLREMRTRWRGDDKFDPYANLLADWGRSDILDDWQREAG